MVNDFTFQSSSISRTVGKRLASTLKDELNNAKMYVFFISFFCVFYSRDIHVIYFDFRGPKFELIATANLTLAEASDLPHTHDLQLVSHHLSNQMNNINNNQMNTRLPLFGHFCCRLAVSPDFMKTSYCAGELDLLPPDTSSTFSGYGRLQAFKITCWDSLQEYENQGAAKYMLDITRDTKLRRRSDSEFLVCNMEEGVIKKYAFRTKQAAETANWEAAIKRAIREHLQWKHVTLSTPMQLTTPGSERNYFLRSGRHGSLYDQVPISREFSLENIQIKSFSL